MQDFFTFLQCYYDYYFNYITYIYKVLTTNIKVNPYGTTFIVIVEFKITFLMKILQIFLMTYLFFKHSIPGIFIILHIFKICCFFSGLRVLALQFFYCLYIRIL